MTQVTTTLNAIREHGPCSDGWVRYYAVDCAERVKHLMEDQRSLTAPNRKSKCSRCGDTGWLDGDPVRGISDEPCGCDENWEE